MLRSLPFPHAGRTIGAQLGARAQGVGARWEVAAVLIGGLLLRLGLLSRPGLHPDEALYASWALRIADGRDPALLGVLVDKPPLFQYLLAGLFRLAGYWGPETADLVTLVTVARLASIGVSVVSLALLWVIARQVYGRQAALFAAALYAVSPLAVRLSPSLLTDPLLVLWVLLGLWAGLNRRSWLTGIACGLAFATKQQAVLLIPLILAVYALSPRLRLTPLHDPDSAGPNLGSLLRLAGGFLLVFTIVLWWDSLRWQWMPSFWERGATAYGGLALAHGRDLLQRFLQWGEIFGYAFGWPLLALLVVSSGIGLRRGRHRLTAFDWLLSAFILVYLTVHLFTTMPPWDRYALPLVPLLALLLGRGLDSLFHDAGGATADGECRANPLRDYSCQFALWSPGVDLPYILRTAAHARGAQPWMKTGGLGRSLREASHRPARAVGAIFRLVIAVMLVYTAWLATLSSIPVGDATAYDGAAQVAEHVRQTQPPGAILYHHWFGWHYGFYLANAPVDLSYWESATDLAAKAAAHSQERQLIAFPVGRDQGSAQQALALAGLRLQPELTVFHKDGTLSATLYRIVPAGSRIDDSVAVGASRYDK